MVAAGTHQVRMKFLYALGQFGAVMAACKGGNGVVVFIAELSRTSATVDMIMYACKRHDHVHMINQPFGVGLAVHHATHQA